jgi:predicted transposase/invertase (TIGR01784 family)
MKKPEKEQREYKSYLESLMDNASFLDTTYVQGKKEGLIEGKIEGIIEGKIEGKIETARLMKQKGFDVSMIAEITGLSISEIDGLTFS